MNFDDDDDSDFNVASAQSGKYVEWWISVGVYLSLFKIERLFLSKLASLFKSNIDTNATTNESLKYKAQKQPQPAAAQPSATTSSAQAASSVLFSSTVKAFK